MGKRRHNILEKKCGVCCVCVWNKNGSLSQLHVYLVMEVLRGGELLERLRRESALTEARASSIFLQLAQAVQAMHSKRVVHRDLKPEVLVFLLSISLCLSVYELFVSLAGRTSCSPVEQKMLL